MQKRIQRFRIFNRRKKNILLRHRNAELLAGVTEAAQTVATRSVYGRVCHICNVAVAAREHVFCNLITSGIVIDIHAITLNALDLTVYAHNGRAGAADVVEICFIGALVAIHRHDEQCGDLIRKKIVNELFFALQILIGITQQKTVTVPLHNAVCNVIHLAEKRCEDLRHDHANHARTAFRKTHRNSAGRIMQRFHGFFHAAAGVFAHIAIVVEHTGHRGLRNPGGLCHVPYGGLFHILFFHNFLRGGAVRSPLRKMIQVRCAAPCRILGVSC